MFLIDLPHSSYNTSNLIISLKINDHEGMHKYNTQSIAQSVNTADV